MDCDQVREALSAVVDGEDAGRPALLRHLENCASCREWQQRAHQLARARLHALDPPSPAAGLRPARPKWFGGYLISRILLGWAGLLIVAWSVPDLVSAGSQLAAHLARHQSAFSIALGITFLIVAWRPDRAYGLVPVAATFAVALTAAAIVDLLNDAASLGRESRHLVEVIGLVILLALGWSAGPGRRRSS